MIPFRNEPLTDFSNEDHRKAFEHALNKVKSELGKEYCLIIGGQQMKTEEKIASINPSNITEVIGTIYQADLELAEKAMQTAATTFETWKNVSPEARARILLRAAAILRRKKHEFSAGWYWKLERRGQRLMLIQQKQLILWSFMHGS